MLCLYNQELLTGLVVNSGHGVTTVCPVMKGFRLVKKGRRSPIAGTAITYLLFECLQKRGHSMNHERDFEVVNTIKEKL